MPTLAELAQRKPVRTIQSGPKSKQGPAAPVRSAETGHGPAKSNRLTLDRDDAIAYLAMRLGISPKRLRAALADYERRQAKEPAERPPDQANPAAPRPVASQGEAAAFRWSGESLASDNHRERNEDCWAVFGPANAIAVFDGVTVATGAADASSQARTMFGEEVNGLKAVDGTQTAQALVQILKKINQAFLAVNSRQQGTHLATTATVGVVLRNQTRASLAYASIGDSRIGIWHHDSGRYELAELDDGLLRMLLLPVSHRPAWVAKLLTGHNLKPDLQLPVADASRLAISLDRDHDPAAASALAQVLFDERNLISQSLGSPKLDIHSGVLPLAAKDRVIFATDGIHDNLTEGELTRIAAGANLSEVATALVVRAHEVAQSASPRAKQDDMTAVIIEIK